MDVAEHIWGCPDEPLDTSFLTGKGEQAQRCFGTTDLNTSHPFFASFYRIHLDSFIVTSAAQNYETSPPPTPVRPVLIWNGECWLPPDGGLVLTISAGEMFSHCSTHCPILALWRIKPKRISAVCFIVWDQLLYPGQTYGVFREFRGRPELWSF